MSWAAVAAGKSIGTSASPAGIDIGKTQLGAIAVSGETLKGGSNTLVNNIPPAEAAAGGESVAAGGAVENPTGTALGKKNKKCNKKKKKASPAVEGSSITPRDAAGLTKTVENSQGGDSKKVATKGKNKASLGVADAAAKPSPANTKDTGNRLSARSSTDGDAAVSQKNEKKGRQTQKYQKLDEFEATPAENKKQSAQMQQFEHILSNKQKGPSVVDTRAEHTNSFVPPTTKSNIGTSARGKAQRTSTDQAAVKASQSTFRPTGILIKPTQVAAVGQQDPLNAPEITGPSHKHSTSVKLPSKSQQKTPPSPSRSLPIKIPSPRAYIASLNLPGISYDEFGICISPAAPQWVRGRIARRVQILMTELEQGVQGSVFDPALELEIEKKEKAFFGRAIWNRLYEIDFRKERSSRELRQEYAEMGGLMRRFDGKMEGEREWRAGRMGTGTETGMGKIGDENAEKIAEIQRSLEEAARRNTRLPQAVVPQAVEGHPVELPNEDFVSGGLPPNLGLPLRPPPPPKMCFPESRFNKNHGWTYRDAYATRMMHSPPPGSLLHCPPPPPSFPHRYAPRTPKLCHHYARNNKCHYGAACRYLHVLPHELELGTTPAPAHEAPRDVFGFSHPGPDPSTAEEMRTPSEPSPTWTNQFPEDMRGLGGKKKSGKARWKPADRKERFCGGRG